MIVFGEAHSGVSKEIEGFMAHGMLTMFEDGRRHYYSVLESPFWAAFAAIGDALGLQLALLAEATVTSAELPS
ncbi:hypothetical protein SAMN05421671_3775 [Pimelobacter simplex]|nr:hypothetical protein SAMN05421671_3775 [Pimelobacter simplex]